MADFGLSTLIESIADALGFGGTEDNWVERLRETITLISPNGNEFEARWRGNPHTITNKLGIHTFPGIVGAKVQDLRAGEEVYNLTLLFTGKNNDINATAFMNNLQNNEGDWRIEHPTKGPLFMVWIDATEQIAPVESGNITVVDTNWIVNLPDTSEESAAQAQAQANFQASIANGASADQFSANAILDAPGKISAVITTVGKAITSAKKALTIIENASILDPRITAILTSIENTLAGDIINTDLLAGQIQAYVQIFGLGQTSATAAIKMYSEFIDEVVQDVPDQATEDGTAQVAATEMIVNAALVAAAQGALIGGNTSRPQVISTAQNLADTFNVAVDGLDEIQDLYNDNLINNRYVSQTGAFADMLLSNTLSIRFLFISLFGLPAERTILLKEDFYPPQLVKQEYGSLGIGLSEDNPGDPFFLSLLYESNDLHGDDLWLLESGRSVLIYQ